MRRRGKEESHSIGALWLSVVYGRRLTRAARRKRRAEGEEQRWQRVQPLLGDYCRGSEEIYGVS